ncbi:unnamed protein product, partial [Closterium sp. NIES-53]
PYAPCLLTVDLAAMASLSAVFTSNPAAIAATSASGGATCFPRPSRSAPAPFLTSSVLPRRRTITTGLNRSSFPTWHGLRAPTSLRRPGIVPFPSLLRGSFGTRGNDLYHGSTSRLPLLAVAAAGDAGGGNRGGTGESEGATGESEAVGELGESGTIREEQPREEEQTGEQAAAEVPPVASDQPNQRLTAHLDLSEVKRQLQRSNERTAESLKHLRSRLHASNKWTAKHLKKSNQQTRENLKHLRNRLHASNEWTLSHLKKGHQWTSEHLRESNERTREQLQHLIHSEQLHHLEEHLDVRTLKARLDASNAKTREGLKRSGRQASHTVHGVADVLSVIGAAAAAAATGAAGAGAATEATSGDSSVYAPGSSASAAAAGTKESAAGGADGGNSKAASSASSSATTKSPARNPYLSGNFRPVSNEVLQELECAVSVPFAISPSRHLAISPSRAIHNHLVPRLYAVSLPRCPHMLASLPSHACLAALTCLSVCTLRCLSAHCVVCLHTGLSVLSVTSPLACTLSLCLAALTCLPRCPHMLASLPSHACLAALTCLPRCPHMPASLPSHACLAALTCLPRCPHMPASLPSHACLAALTCLPRCPHMLVGALVD